MTRAFQAAALFAGAFSMSMFIACGDKDDTGGTDDGGTEDGGTDGGTAEGETECDDGEDNDEDGRIDCDDSDCRSATACQVFEPTFLSFEASTGVMEGVQTEITFEGKPLGSYFTIMMINDDWEGPDDDKNFCAIVYDVSGAVVDSSCANCWAGASWAVDTSMLVGTAGECDKLDPDDWTDDPAAYLSESTYGFGFGPLSSAETAFQDALESGFGTYWSEYSDNVFVNYIQSDLSGTPTWYNMAYAFGYEIDATGAIVGDGSSMISVGDSAFAPDGYYSGNFFYGFSVE